MNYSSPAEEGNFYSLIHDQDEFSTLKLVSKEKGLLPPIKAEDHNFMSQTTQNNRTMVHQDSKPPGGQTHAPLKHATSPEEHIVKNRKKPNQEELILESYKKHELSQQLRNPLTSTPLILYSFTIYLTTIAAFVISVAHYMAADSCALS